MGFEEERREAWQLQGTALRRRGDGFVNKRRDDRVNDGRDDSMETGVRGREERGTIVIR